jgi:hypothetical protein
MKRVLAVAALAVTTVFVTATTALAGDYPPPGGTGGVEGAGGSTAFTGGDVATGVIIAAVLLALGTIALFVARRNTARTAA